VDTSTDMPGRVPQVPELVPAPTGDKVLLGGPGSSWYCSSPSCSGAAPWRGLGGCHRQRLRETAERHWPRSGCRDGPGAAGEQAPSGHCVLPQAPAWSGTPRAASTTAWRWARLAVRDWPAASAGTSPPAPSSRAADTGSATTTRCFSGPSPAPVPAPGWVSPGSSMPSIPPAAQQAPVPVKHPCDGGAPGTTSRLTG